MLIDLLRRAADSDPDQPAVITGERSWTYAECVERSESLARGLAERELTRFGCAVDDPADTLMVLAAGSIIGSEACAYTRWLDPERIVSVAHGLGHVAVVTDDELDLADVESLPIDRLAAGAADRELPEPAETPVLILTTGTTGHQRAARYDWSRLIGGVGQSDQRHGQRWLLAYNLAQFGGIQMLLHALASRATLVVARSRRPEDSRDAIEEHRVTRASATPTFWRLLSGTLDEDRARRLPLEQITLGGEAVSDALLARLRRLFPGAQISQIYGATEFGTAVSVNDGRSGLPASVLDRGEDASIRLRIVDGELQMRSRIGMQGYHGEGEADRGWRGTGDLVELDGDRVRFMGRRSEIINVGGAKVHPLPVENAAASVPGVELVTAYGRSNPVTGQIVALDVVPSPGAVPDDVEAAIRDACAALPAASRPRSIRFVAELEVMGHKLTRRAVRAEP